MPDLNVQQSDPIGVITTQHYRPVSQHQETASTLCLTLQQQLAV